MNHVTREQNTLSTQRHRLCVAVKRSPGGTVPRGHNGDEQFLQAPKGGLYDDSHEGLLMPAQRLDG